MNRVRILLATLGVTALGAGMLLLRPHDVPQQAESLSAPGRYRDGRGRMGREGPATADTGPAALCDAVTVADKVGAWECMKGDGTMLAGSATTFVSVGTVTNTTENGWPVRSYAIGTTDQQPAEAAFPASDFTVCNHHRTSVEFISGPLSSFSLAYTNSVVYPFFQGAAGTFNSYVVSNEFAESGIAGGFSTIGTWKLMCFVYTRVGDGTSSGALYLNGDAAVASSTTMVLAGSMLGKWVTNGLEGSPFCPANTATRGFFVTYKALSAADIARIYARLAP